MNTQEMASVTAILKEQLAPLAEKIGQGAEFAYGLFKKQVYVNAIKELTWFVPLFVWIWGMKKIYGKIMKIEDDWERGNDFILFWAVGGLVLAFLGIGCLVGVGELIGALINPDYQAIKLILEAIK